MQNLTHQQIENIKKVLGGSSVKLLKTPIEYHQLLLHWNFDDGIEPLEYIVEQPETDLGTVVLLYWLIGPGSIFQFREKKPQLFALLQKIEKNVAAGFYQNQNISVNPVDSEGTNFTAERANQEYFDKIPEIFKNPTPGENVKTIELVTKHSNQVYPLSETDLVKLSKNIDAGLEILQNIVAEINRDSKPKEILTAIDKYCLSKRPADRTENKFSRQDLHEFKNLEFVMGEQMVRRGGFQWYIHEEYEMVLNYRDFVLISNDHKYEWNPMGVLMKDLVELEYYGQTPATSMVNDYENIETFKKSKIKITLGFQRENNEEYANKSDDELIQILTQKMIDEYRQVPYYAQKFEGASDAEIMESLQHELNTRIFGQVLPNQITDFETFRKRYEFMA